MGLSLEDFLKHTGAELVADNIILGVQSDRRVVGSLKNGVHVLTEEGHDIANGILEGKVKEKAIAAADVKRKARGTPKAESRADVVTTVATDAPSLDADAPAAAESGEPAGTAEGEQPEA